MPASPMWRPDPTVPASPFPLDRFDVGTVPELPPEVEAAARRVIAVRARDAEDAARLLAALFPGPTHTPQGP